MILIVILLFLVLAFTRALGSFNPTNTLPIDFLSYERQHHDLVERANPDAAGLRKVPGLGRPIGVVEGWEGRLNPLEAFYPSQNSTESLEIFYNWVKDVLTHQADNTVAGNELELGTHLVCIRCEANGVFGWSVILKFLEWIVSAVINSHVFVRLAEAIPDI